MSPAGRRLSEFVLVGLLAVPAGQACARQDVWGVLAPGLPSRVSVADERTNVSFYILKQTHEPLFRRHDGENYTSGILKKWSRSLDYREFSFCPDTTLEFSQGLPLVFEDFAAHISSYTSGYSAGFHLEKAGGCVKISFDSPQKDYLYFWTLHRYAPTKKAGENAELGLGAFYVKSILNEKIVLARKRRVRGGYNSVVLYDYKGPGDPNLEDPEIRDFNLISTDAVPERVRRTYRAFDNPEIKAQILLINHSDHRVRALVYNCFDIQAFRAAYFPDRRDFFNIATVLPMGVPGAAPGMPAQNCRRDKAGGVRLKLANWGAGNREELLRFAAALKAKSGIDLIVDQYSIGEFRKAYYSRPKPFDLGLIMVYVDAQPAEFFSMFFDNGGAYDFDVRPFSGKYHAYLKSQSRITSEEAFREFSLEVSRNALALPLSQSIRTLYYPKEIKNLSVGSGILEYAEVAGYRF